MAQLAIRSPFTGDLYRHNHEISVFLNLNLATFSSSKWSHCFVVLCPKQTKSLSSSPQSHCRVVPTTECSTEEKKNCLFTNFFFVWKRETTRSDTNFEQLFKIVHAQTQFQQQQYEKTNRMREKKTRKMWRKTYLYWHVF